MSDHFDKLRAAIAQAEARALPPMDLLRDLCQVVDPIKRNGLRTLLQELKAKKTALEIPSVTQAFLERAPAVVGADLWRQCCEKQRPRGDPEAPRLNAVRRPAPALKKKVIKWKLSGCTVAVTPVMAPDTSRAYRGSRHKRGRYVEGAEQKKNGKWINPEMFPGREFDDLDEYRAAKKQRVEQRIAYSEQNIGRRK